MYQDQAKFSDQPSLKQLVIVVVSLLVIGVYLFISLAAGDTLWFWPLFEEEPYRIVVHCYGTDVAVDSSSANFNYMNSIINEIMSGRKRWDQLSLSDQSYLEYQIRTDMLTVEAFYDPAVRVHTFYKFFSNVEILIIPLVGRHTSSNAVFGRATDIRTGDTLPSGGSLSIQDPTPLLDYIQTVELCPSLTEVSSP